ncbi:hypothetical protein [Sphingomicrobium astaxanthinifaciens]|uniref:hypothetical protein n=1 Tax=Sphingomicrobium astaxanthinifaciens TaxID=1227949 RepID=UPI001FCC782C|nr:hypothetical protein [Sphingomicrobium astaxanthinifaciens]MCJ7421536.1 hypothetical protein [Sphingomicrobium astaxanthinifaciens]
MPPQAGADPAGIVFPCPTAELERLSSDLLGAVDRFQADQDAHLFGLRLSRLLTLIRLQLARADIAARARAQARDDAALARLARAAAEEGEAVAATIERFARRYADAGSAISDFTNFRHDARVLVGHLAERVERERAILPRLAGQLRAVEAKRP